MLNSNYNYIIYIYRVNADYIIERVSDDDLPPTVDYDTVRPAELTLPYVDNCLAP